MLAMKSSAALLTPSTTGPRLEQRRWGVPAPAGMDPYSNSRHRSVEGRASRALLTCGEEGVGDAQTAFESGSVYFGVSGADSMRAGHGEPIVRVSSVTHLSDDVVDAAQSTAAHDVSDGCFRRDRLRQSAGLPRKCRRRIPFEYDRSELRPDAQDTLR